ncbi:AbrB/MazE/SpoVT family DNA-binding domain-containing protein [Pseudoflavonifractor phocaeensis]|nr:AbrB/MazE/SpoVT family DNA-binding domain-containing protein [Pseudoflavonifractor phocaeensis]
MFMTAIIRRMDPLGRVVIPKSIREQLGWQEGTPIEVIGSDDGIYLREQQTLTLSERVRRLQKEAVQEGASVEVIYQMNQLLDVLEDC